MSSNTSAELGAALRSLEETEAILRTFGPSPTARRTLAPTSTGNEQRDATGAELPDLPAAGVEAAHAAWQIIDSAGESFRDDQRHTQEHSLARVVGRD